jgi:hypothetical protein
MKNPNGHEYEYKFLPPDELVADLLYQRPINMRRVEKMFKEFNGNVFNEPKVSFRDGKYYIFDGDHSVALWKKLFPDGNTPIYCKVFYGMTWEEECEAFIAQNGISKDPTTNEKLRAAYNAKNPDVVDMVRRAEMFGFLVDFSPSKAINRIVGTSTLFKAYKSLGPSDYSDMLDTIKSAWGYDPDALHNNIIRGMATVFKKYRGEIDKKAMITAMSRTSPSAILRDGKLFGNSRNAYAIPIVRAYNYKKRNNKLDEAKL